MLQQLDKIDKELIVWLNGFHSPFWDSFMITVTGKLIWVPLYLVLVLFLLYVHRKDAWIPLLSVIIMVILTDQIASGLMKPLIERFRPCHNAELQQLLYFPAGCGGTYGFFSSHASNMFGLAAFFCFMHAKKYKVLNLLWIWAAVVTYSRVYLAVHYPGDVLAGTSCGILLGWIAATSAENLLKRKYLKLTTTGSGAS